MTQSGEHILNILASEDASSALRNMHIEGTLSVVLPEVSALDIQAIGHKNNFDHTMKVLDNACAVSKDPWFRLAALLHDIGKAKARRQNENKEWTFYAHEIIGSEMLSVIWQRLGFPQDKYDMVECITRWHGQAKNLGEIANDSAIRRFYNDTEKFFEELILFCKCDMTTKFREKIEKQRKQLEDLRIRTYELKKADEEAKYRIPFDGHWLMQQVDERPGPWLKETMEEVKRAIKSGELLDEEEVAKDYAINILKVKGLIK